MGAHSREERGPWRRTAEEVEENGAELEIGAGRRLGRKTGLGGVGARCSAGARHKAAGAHQGEWEQQLEGKGTDASGGCGWKDTFRVERVREGQCGMNGRMKASIKPFPALRWKQLAWLMPGWCRRFSRSRSLSPGAREFSHEDPQHQVLEGR